MRPRTALRAKPKPSQSATRPRTALRVKPKLSPSSRQPLSAHVLKLRLQLFFQKHDPEKAQFVNSFVKQFSAHQISNILLERYGEAPQLFREKRERPTSAPAVKIDKQKLFTKQASHRQSQKREKTLDSCYQLGYATDKNLMSMLNTITERDRAKKQRMKVYRQQALEVEKKLVEDRKDQIDTLQSAVLYNSFQWDANKIFREKAAMEKRQAKLDADFVESIKRQAEKAERRRLAEEQRKEAELRIRDMKELAKLKQELRALYVKDLPPGVKPDPNAVRNFIHGHLGGVGGGTGMSMAEQLAAVAEQREARELEERAAQTEAERRLKAERAAQRREKRKAAEARRLRHRQEADARSAVQRQQREDWVHAALLFFLLLAGREGRDYVHDDTTRFERRAAEAAVGAQAVASAAADGAAERVVELEERMARVFGGEQWALAGVELKLGIRRVPQEQEQEQEQEGAGANAEASVATAWVVEARQEQRLAQRLEDGRVAEQRHQDFMRGQGLVLTEGPLLLKQGPGGGVAVSAKHLASLLLDFSKRTRKGKGKDKGKGKGKGRSSGGSSSGEGWGGNSGGRRSAWQGEKRDYSEVPWLEQDYIGSSMFVFHQILPRCIRPLRTTCEKCDGWGEKDHWVVRHKKVGDSSSGTGQRQKLWREPHFLAKDTSAVMKEQNMYAYELPPANHLLPLLMAELEARALKAKTKDDRRILGLYGHAVDKLWREQSSANSESADPTGTGLYMIPTHLREV